MIGRMPGLKSEDLGLSSGLKKTNGSASCFPDLWEEMKEAYVLGTRGEPGTCDVGTHQVPLSMGFSRQVYWSGLPFSSPGDIPDPGIEPVSPALRVDSLTLSHQTVLPPSRLLLCLTVGQALLFPVS